MTCILVLISRTRVGFRRASISQQYARFLEADGRTGVPVRPVIAKIAGHRVALTYSEPDNVRSAVLGQVISATGAERFAAELRPVAEWLWKDSQSGPNCFISP